MDSIIRGTNATIQIKIKEDIDFSQLSSLEMCIYQATKKIVKPQSELIIDAEARTITYVTSQEESFSLAPNRNANGTYRSTKDGYNPVTVNVPERVPITESLSVTQNAQTEFLKNEVIYAA